MNMNKKRIIIILGISIIACLGGAFWLLRSHQPEKQASSIASIGSIPYDAILIVQFKELSLIDKKFADSSAVWKNFLTKPSPLLTWLHNTMLSFPNDETGSEILRSQTSISIHPLGKDDIALLCSIALPSTVDANSWEQLLNRYGQPPELSSYDNTKIYSLRFSNDLLFFAYVKGTVLICTSTTLLQSAIRQSYSGESWEEHDVHFATVIKTLASNENIGMCVNHKMLNRFLSNVEGKPLTAVNRFLTQCSDWTVLDGNINPQSIQLSGFSFPLLSNNKFLSVLLNQGGNNVEAWEVLPANTSFLLSFTLNDPQRFLNDYADYLDKYKVLFDYKKRIARFDDTLNNKAFYCKTDELFTAFSPVEIAFANLTYGSNNYQLSLIKSNNPQYALERLQKLSEHRKQTFIELQDKADEQTITVYRHPARGLLDVVIDSLFFKDNDKYFTLIDNFFCFSDNVDVLKNLAGASTKNSLKKQLQSEAHNFLNNNANILLVSRRPQQAGNALLHVFDKNIQNNFRKTAEQYACNVQALQLRPENDKFFINFFTLFAIETEKPELDELPKNSGTTTTTSNASNTKQDNQANNKTLERLRVEVINHYTKEKEYFIQYGDNSIVLQTKDGKPLWRKNIPAPITGSVIQIDFLKNKKLQCLFFAGGKLYLYDRNGHIVKPFPVTLQSAVTLESGSTTTVQKQPPVLQIAKGGKTTIIYLNNGKVERK